MVALVHLIAVQAKFLRRPSMGLTIPPIGEQNTIDIQE
jgi:hypothetical protein